MTCHASHPRRRRAFARRGFTLVEGMFASVLLATSTIAISGAMSAAWQNDLHSERQKAALRTGQQMMNEVTSLPVSPTAAGGLSMNDYAAYEDDLGTAGSGSLIGSRSSAKTKTTGTSTSTSTSNSGTGSSNSGSSGQSGLLGNVLGTVENVVNGILGNSAAAAPRPSGSYSASTSTVSTVAASTLTDKTTGAKRKLKIKRTDTLNGSTSSSGDLAVIEVSVRSQDGNWIKLKRLVSTSEGNANAMK